MRLALKMLSAVPQSEISISGKTVLITGATSGLGLATALLLAERGAEVVMMGRDRTRANFMRTEVAKCAAGNAPILFLADLSSQAERLLPGWAFVRKSRLVGARSCSLAHAK